MSTGKRISRLLLDTGLQQKQLIERMAGRGEVPNKKFIFTAGQPLMSKVVNDRGGLTPDLLMAMAEALNTTADHIMGASWAESPNRQEGDSYLHHEDAIAAATAIDGIHDDEARQSALADLEKSADAYRINSERKTRLQQLYNELIRVTKDMSDKEKARIESRIGIKLSRQDP